LRSPWGLGRAWQWLVRKSLVAWVKVAVKPDAAATGLAAADRPVCYVLERDGQSDLAVLGLVCGRRNLPRPSRRLLVGGIRTDHAHFELERRVGLLRSRVDKRPPRTLVHLMSAVAKDPEFDVDLVPVAVFWGRAAPKESSWWRLPFTETWSLVGRVRRIFTILFNGRNTLLHFGEPVSLRAAMQGEAQSAATARRIVRALRATLRAQRTSTIGPDLSHRRTIVARVLAARAVRNAIRAEARARGIPRRAAILAAKRCADEIAANYSRTFIGFMSVVLGWLWNRLYDGVTFRHVERLQEIGDGAEIVYVPCHRSHMDYLLLSYVIYHKGFAIPHIAAGVNLNMPVVGRFLRKGGAFFLRRSFKGDALYASVFKQYLGLMMSRGHPLEYFIEGGRSRTGRLLQPRTGMLSMTVQGYLRDPRRPVVFVPVYFGYERIVEGETYLDELAGRPKRKESVAGLLKAVPALRQRFGEVHVNLGEPIALDAVLSAHDPRWRERAAGDDEPRFDGLGAAVGDLARRIVTGINAAAAVTPINLVATAVLATPRQASAEADLVAQLDLYRQLLRDAPYGPLVTVTAASGAQMVAYAEAFGLLRRRRHALGDVLSMTPDRALLATYYRNNTLHLLAIPSLLACCFLGNASMRAADILRLLSRIYPYIAAELFLRWGEDEVGDYALRVLEVLAGLGLLSATPGRDEWHRPPPATAEAVRLSGLAAATIQTVERYYLAIALLLRAGSGRIGQQALEESCRLTAQRMSLLYGFESPEFFDQAMFRNFLELLRRRGVVRVGADGTLCFDAALSAVAVDAQIVLSEQIRHSILQVTSG
jgi:glycerol-3-phosphate O-acyltransferase